MKSMRLATLLLLVACGTDASPTPTGAVCPSPDPMTFAYSAADTPGCVGTAEQCNFGKTFMDAYCISCHNSALPRSQRNGAPLYHDFDSFLGVIVVIEHIDEQTGVGPNAHNAFMPDAQGGKCPSVPGGPLDVDCPEPTTQERTDLAVWLACERDRPH